MNLLLSMLMAVSVNAAGGKTKPSARKPQQASHYYVCVFQKKSGEKLFEFSIRVPEQEKSLQYEESNRMTTLKTGVYREGWVTVEYTDNVAAKTIGKGRVRTDFNGPFAVEIAGKEAHILDCR